MPKLKKPDNIAEEKKAAWRTPVKLPSITAAEEPMKSLYASGADEPQIAPRVENAASKLELLTDSSEGATQIEASRPQKSSGLPLTGSGSHMEEPLPTASQNRKKSAVAAVEPSLADKQAERAAEPEKLGVADFLRLLKTEKMDFYSLAEILRGSSMALYCVLYSESLAKGENRCQIRQNDLMMRAGINNPATLYKQERWLTTLGLISKSVRLGNHSGASYEIRPLETLPLPSHILNQFGGYLTEQVK